MDFIRLIFPLQSQRLAPKACKESKSCTSEACKENKSCTSEACKESKSCTSEACKENKSCTSETCKESKSCTSETCKESKPCTSETCKESKSRTSETCKESKPCTSEASCISLNNVLEDLCSSSKNKIIIAGPERYDKTCMAFQATVTAVSMGYRVIYICTHKFNRLPYPVHGMIRPKSRPMNNVDFLYLEDHTMLLWWLSNVHTKMKLPSFLVIEDILYYATGLNESNIEMGLARLCAIISNSCSWIGSHNETGGCGVLLTAPSRIASLDFVFSQYDFTMAEFKGPPEENPTGSSLLSYQWENGKIEVTFKRTKGCIIMQDVIASQNT